MVSPPKAAPASSNSTDTKEGQKEDKQDEQSTSPPPKPSPPTPSPPPPSPPPPSLSPPPPSPPSPPPPSIPPPPSSPSEGKTPTPPPQTPSNKHDRNPSTHPPPLLPPPKSKQDVKSSPEGNIGGSQKSPAKKDKESNGNDAIIAGAVIGVVLFLILVCISASICYFCKKKKKNRKPDFYSDGGGANGYYNGGGYAPQKQQDQGGQHTVKNPRPPGMAVPASAGWHGGPAPLSGEVSTAFTSGPQGPVLPPPSPTLAMGFNKSSFTYEELAAATGGFSQSNLIGQGGFGYVFKGTLPNGKDVAVKQLKAGSGQGEREFQAEVEIISRVHHRHLVSLVGYCIAGAQRILIYEFVPNKTLEYHLHRSHPIMDWPTRLKIAIGSAKGLAYLHEDCHPRIIHRDIKTANILIDYKFEAMVADFGLAKLSSDTNTHVSTRVMGTFGYLAPEYASTGKLTDKSDVFSFGVMLLELITGRRPVDHTNRMEDSLVDWARPILRQVLADENYGEVVDPRLEGNYNPAEMARMIACGAACVRHSGRRRPRMSQIVRALEGDMISFDDLSAGVKAGQGSQSSSGTEVESSTHSTKMRDFQRVAMASGEFPGEYSGETSEYSPHPSDSSASVEMQVGAGRKPREDV